jgi:hypothetical protein
VNTERHKVYEIARITETLSNFLSNEIAAMGRDERMFTPLDLEIAVHKRILEAYEAGEIAMREKAAQCSAEFYLAKGAGHCAGDPCVGDLWG